MYTGHEAEVIMPSSTERHTMQTQAGQGNPYLTFLAPVFALLPVLISGCSGPVPASNAELASLQIIGHDSVAQGTTVTYTVLASYTDGSTVQLNSGVTWMVAEGLGSIDSVGNYTAPTSVSDGTSVTIRADYAESGIAADALKHITLKITTDGSSAAPTIVWEQSQYQGIRPVAVTTRAYRLSDSELPDGAQVELPEGTYIWTFDATEDSGPMASHSSRSYSFTQPGRHTVTLAILLAGTVNPVSCVGVRSGTTTETVIVWPRISGEIIDRNGNPIAGVTITSDDGSRSTTTDSNGTYNLDVPYEWTGTLRVHITGFDISPSQLSYQELTTDKVNQNFQAETVTYAISGKVVDTNGTALAGAYINATGISASAGQNFSTVTDTNGTYVITVPYGWSGDISSQLSGFSLEPLRDTRTDVIANITGVDFVGTRKQITAAGRVLDSIGNSLSNVTIQATGAFSWAGTDVTATTEVDGTYSMTLPYGWAGDISAQIAGYTFTPVSYEYDKIVSKTSGVDFTGVQNEIVITGHLTDSNSANLGNVSMTATGTYGSTGQDFSATSESDGMYSISVPYGWSGNLIPTRTGYTFSPASRTYANITSATTGADFSGSLDTMLVSGTTVTNLGENLASVTVIATGTGSSTGENHTAISGTNGFYSFSVPYGWAGTISPQLADYTFNPPNRSYTSITTESSGVNFTGTHTPVSIGGYAMSNLGQELANVTITATGSGSSAGLNYSATTSTDGTYTVEVPYGWSGTIVAQVADYTFSPTSRTYADLETSVSAAVFIGTHDPITIAGHITSNLGGDLAGVAVTATGSGSSAGQNDSTTSGTDGSYSVSVPYGWTGTVSVQLTDYTFAPANRSYSAIASSTSADDFVGTHAAVTISGYIRNSSNAAIQNVTVQATGSADSTGDDDTATTAADGSYTLTVPYDWTGRVTPSLSGYTFVPSHKDYSDIHSNQASQNYLGTTVTSVITGEVTDYQGTARANVPVEFTGTGAYAGSDYSTSTAGDGVYAQEVPYGWTGTVTSDDNFRLDPATRSYSNVTAPQSAQDFEAFRNYYVDKPGDGLGSDGDDSNDGTYSQPFATIQQAVDATVPGDTVLVRAGTYDSGSTSSNDSVILIDSTSGGTASYPKRIAAVSGDTVIIDGRDTTRLSVVIQSSYIEFEGFELIGALRTAVSIENSGSPGTVHHVTVRYCHAHDNDGDVNYIGGAFVAVGPVHYITFEDCISNNNAGGFQLREYPTQTASTALVPPDGMAESDWDTWEGWTEYGARYCEFRRCMAYDNTLIDEHSDGFACRYAIDCLFEDNIGFHNVDDNFDFLGSTRCTIRNCIALEADPAATENGDGNGIKIGVRGGLANLVYNNICLDNPRAGIDMADTEHPKVYNNTCYNNAWFGIWFEGARSSTGGITARNNVCKGNTQGDIGALPAIPVVDFDYNCVADDNSHSWGIAPGTNGYISTDPQFANESLVIDYSIPPGLTIPEKLDFIRSQVEAKLSLDTGSPMIDTGSVVSGVTDGYNGSSPDRGALESQ